MIDTAQAAAVASLAVGLGAASAAPRQAKLTNVTLQLKWVPQAQFAGYYAAVKQGFYAKEGLNVTLKNGGPDIIPEQVVASGQAELIRPSFMGTPDGSGLGATGSVLRPRALGDR